jgi:transposase
VDSVELNLETGEIHVRLAHHDMIDWPCPECGSACRLYDHQPERQWRHLDTCQYQTILHAEPPRSECSNHGVRVVKMPWAEPSSRFTALFELLAIEWLKAASQKAVATLLKLSWDEIHGILERAVKRGLERRQAELVSQMGVDEKAFRKGHSYLTLVNDLLRACVLYVAEDRKQSSLDGFWDTLTVEQISGIEAIAMDMWGPYIVSVREDVPEPDGKIALDKFHVAQHLGDAVDQTARGFRNRQNFVHAIYFHCGGLDLAPASDHQRGQRIHQCEDPMGEVH